MHISLTITNGIRNYWSHVAGFSHNARLFLWSSLLGGLVISIYDLLFNFYLECLGYRQDFLGLMASLSQLVIFITSLPASLLSDVIGRKRALILGGVANTLALLGLIVFTTTEGIILMTVLYGASTALLIVVGPPFMMENSGIQERTHLFSWYQAVVAFAGIAAGFLGGNLPGWFAGWLKVGAQDTAAYQAAIVAMAFINGVSVIPLVVLRTSGGARRAVRHPLAGMRADGALLFKILFPNLLIALGAGLFIPFRNIFFRARFGVSDSEVGVIFSLAALVAAVAIVFGPVTAQRFGKIRAVVAQQFLSVPLILVTGFAPIYSVVVVAALVRTALMQMSGPVFNAYTMEVVREETRGTTSSLMNMVWTLGWVVSAPISGQLQLGGDWSLIFIAMALLYAIGIGLMQVYFGRTTNSR